MSDTFKIAIIQTSLFWENKYKNLEHFRKVIERIMLDQDLVVLPEMFTTGFSMNVDEMKEPYHGATLGWMKEMARENECSVTGSFIVEENSKYYNRLAYVFEDGEDEYYDKRHLFSLGNEQHYYSSGSKKLIVEQKGWKICPQICYDLRFPVWNRNDPDPFDVQIFVANWPEKRITAWRKLLQARAIENQCFVIGVNRIGVDGNKMEYSGDSLICDPLGEIMVDAQHKDGWFGVEFSKTKLNTFREKLPFLKDADKFKIIE